MDIAEIGAARNAVKYGDAEPLLAHFVEHGLHERESREIVAKLARGKSLRGRGDSRNRAEEIRNERICMLLENRRGLLSADGKDTRRANSIVAGQLQRTDDAMDRKTVKRIWDNRRRSITLTMALTMAYDLGRRGVELSPELADETDTK